MDCQRGVSVEESRHGEVNCLLNNLFERSGVDGGLGCVSSHGCFWECNKVVRRS